MVTMISRTLEESRHPRRGFWRVVLLLLLIIPSLPEIAILVTSALAKIMGCEPGQRDACLIGSLPASDIIAFALQAGAGVVITGVRMSQAWLVAFYVAIIGCLIASYVALILGWARTLNRLLLGLVVAVFFAFVPYFGPMMAVAHLANPNCRPDDSGTRPCTIFGGYVGDSDYSPANDAVALGWLGLYGVPLSFAMFVGYAIVVIVIGVISAKRAVTSVQ
jgi:hypothetical protein